MRKKTAKALAQKRAAQRARKEAAKNYTDDLPSVDFGVLRIDGYDRVILFGDPKSEGDSYEQNFQAFGELLKEAPKESFATDGNYVNIFELSEDGRAYQKYNLKNDRDPAFESWYQALSKHFQALVEAEYDKVFPQIAADMKQHVEKFVREISKKTNVPVVVPVGASINPEYWISLIREYMEKAKQQMIATGEARGVFGWGVDEGTFLCNLGMPTQKYRFGRAIAEVASIINAPFIIQGGEMWVRDYKTGKRTGDEAIVMNVILPDGTIAAQGYLQFRRIACPLKFEESHVEVIDKKDLKQFLFPKWGYFPTPATVAA